MEIEIHRSQTLETFVQTNDSSSDPSTFQPSLQFFCLEWVCFVLFLFQGGL